MIINKTSYKNIDGILLKNEYIEVIVLPTEGSKIASIKNNKGFEYLYQNPSLDYKKLSLLDDYALRECSGYDDLFPTIDPDIYNGIKYPDHGEVARLSFNYEIKNDKLFLYTKSLLFNYTYKKAISLMNNKIVIEYEIINNDNKKLYCLWAMHCLLNSSNETNIRIENKTPLYLMFDKENEKGNPGDYIDCNGTINIDRSMKNCYKYYYQNKNGRIIYNYDKNNSLSFCFDKDILKETGIWINNGSFNDFYCVGIEPATIGYDSLSNAKKHSEEFYIEPNGKLSFRIEIELN